MHSSISVSAYKYNAAIDSEKVLTALPCFFFVNDICQPIYFKIYY